MDSVERYLETFERLRRGKRWSTDTTVLRFAALTLAATETPCNGAELENLARVMVDEAGGFSPLSSSMRHAVAAIVLRRGLDGVAVVRRVRETLAVFKQHRLRKGGAHPWLAALLLVLDAGGELPSPGRVARLKSLIDRWAEDHFFLTGVDDYPMAAMHAVGDRSVEELGVEVEQIYRALRKAKYGMGNQLQLVSHLLVFADQGSAVAADRFDRLAKALRAGGQRIWQSHYDEVALLVLSRAPIDEAAARAIEYRDRLRAVKPRPEASIAFSIAAGVVLAEQAEKLKQLDGARTAASLRAVQAIIEAQQAAIVACMAATTAATTAATAG